MLCVYGVYSMSICTDGWCFLLCIGDFTLDVSGGECFVF